MRHFFLLSVAMLLNASAYCQIFRTYKTGYYFSTSGQKVEGLISSTPYAKEISYKSAKGSKPVKIAIEDLKAIVVIDIISDSLTVMKDNTGEVYFAKFLFESPAAKFYYRFKKVVQGGAPVMTSGVTSNPSARGSSPSFTNTQRWSSGALYSGMGTELMVTDGSGSVEITKKNFTAILIKVLADSPAHVSQLKNKEVKYKNLEEFLETYHSF